MKPIHCPMIHSGLQLRVENNQTLYNHCCLSDAPMVPIVQNFWKSAELETLRLQNNNEVWHKNCDQCKTIELSGGTSLRLGTLEKLGVHKNLIGPQRIDLMFDQSCNLACRTCGPNSSTFWQRHLKDNNLWNNIESYDSGADKIIETLKLLDLSQLKMVVFCGGETLMGPNYWKVVDFLATTVPQQITLSFQTNGTQSIDQRHYELISKFQLVKLNISLDGVANRFNYLRWPANWNQVVDNINNLRENLPVNVMFLIEETISIFNLYYQNELSKWAEQNFNSNRLGDIINHTRHLAHGEFGLHNLTEDYIRALQRTNLYNFVGSNFIEDTQSIRKMINEIQKFDKIRNENWRTTFPEVAEFYSRYL
jgi:organic radical activating enzyme